MRTYINNAIGIENNANIKQQNIESLCFTIYLFLIQICWNCFCLSIVSLDVLTELSIIILFSIFATTCNRIPNTFFFTHIYIYFF